ncbi:hypothetical protein DD509_05660 [Dehalogenimonas alkenigignens]|nr:hypothetical protein DD509_05660 [Dehalogenimonas alkenigignens]
MGGAMKVNKTGRKLSAAGRRPKRELIIETTVELFRQAHDVRKVSIGDIAQAASVSPTTVYNQFGSRDALIGEAARSLILDTVAFARSVLKSDLPFARKLTGLISGKISRASQAPDEVVAKIISQDRDIAPFIEELFRREVKPLWIELLEEGKRQGYIDASVDPDAFTVYLDVLRAGYAALPELARDWKSNMDLIEQLTRLTFYGFLTKEIDLFGKKESA